MFPLRHIHLQTAAWTGVALALLALLWLLAPILTPFALAAVFAYLCNPMVDALARRRLPRTVAALLVVGGLAFVLIALAFVLLPMLHYKAMMLVQKLPALADLFNEHAAPML
ncbi:MAG: AI-2E family transporter, partial [Betaproteobacteria bacterium]|nr:AI-2E family transporter [Betaproteobacteria bacterium]